MNLIDVSWPVCEAVGCIGIKLASGNRCLGHASASEVDAAIDQVRATAIIDARGVEVSEQLLERLLGAAPKSRNGDSQLAQARFDQATFPGSSVFNGVAVTGHAVFSGATFANIAVFRGATFVGATIFTGTTFSGDAVFESATIGGATFSKATFTGKARFGGATFTADARFDQTTFLGGARFGGATFTADARFDRAVFSSIASFGGTSFSKNALFLKASFKGDARFDRTTFAGKARFDKVTFSAYTEFEHAKFADIADFDWSSFFGITSFKQATFSGTARFNEVNFNGSAAFDEVTFASDARFNRATFSMSARFDKSRFIGDSAFGRATFASIARFNRAKFFGQARFNQVTFTGNVTFHLVTFAGDSAFSDSTFSDNAIFNKVTFERLAVFSNAKFGQTRQFGPLLVRQRLVLDGAEFAQSVQIQVSSIGVSCRRARFPRGVQFGLRWALVALDEADFPEPSILTGSPRLPAIDLTSREEQFVKIWRQDHSGEIFEVPQLLSLIRANVAGLSLSNVSVADCRFAGAHNLDKMRLEADVSFAVAPSILGGAIRKERQVIAEERDWRASRTNRSAWQPAPWPSWLGERPRELDAGQIADRYRALRKGREDAKNEPGASDFYYGEMEMRRHAFSFLVAERSIIWLYWLMSGYGLRALRSLAALVVFGAIITTALTGWGLAAGAPASTASQQVAGTVSTVPRKPDRINATISGVSPQLPPANERLTGERVLTALEVTFESFVFRTTDQPLTTAGTWTTIAARILGPVLLALTLLAVRNRVKR